MPEALLLTDPFLERAAANLGETYKLERLWDFPSHDAFLDGPGKTMRAIVTMSGRTPPNEFLARMPALKLIACMSTGYEGIDVDWCKAHGVAVTNGAAANGNDVADMAVGLLISAYRNLTLGDRRIRAGAWVNISAQVRGRSLRGKRVGVVGLGRIGRQIADRCAAFDMDVRWTGPNPKPDVPYQRHANVLELAQACDALIVAAPASAETDKLINRAVIDALGKEGVIVNIARGALIDERELVAALREGRLLGAGLDVFEEEPTPSERWRDLQNVTLTPHSAGATPEGGQAMTDKLLDNLACFFAGKPLASPIY